MADLMDWGISLDTAVDAEDGLVGFVRRVIVDAQSGAVRALVVDQSGRQWVVPLDAVESANGNRVRLRGAWSRVAGVRPFDPHEFAAEPSTLGEAATPVRARTAAELAGVAAVANGRDRQTPRVSIDESIPHLTLREERPVIVRQLEQIGALRVSRSTVEHLERIEVPLREELVTITCLPGQGPIRIGDRELAEGESIVVTLMREEAEVHTRAVWEEGVRVRTEWVERQTPVQQTLRREELDVRRVP
jgi:uncharacterized protein (TIGR02271 family)